MHNSDKPFFYYYSIPFFPKHEILASFRRLAVLSTTLYANTKNINFHHVTHTRLTTQLEHVIRQRD